MVLFTFQTITYNIFNYYMSSIDGEFAQPYNKTLNGLNLYGDITTGNLVVAGNLIVEGTTKLEGDLNMDNNKITFLSPGTALTDAANVGQITTIADLAYLRIDGTNAMTADIDIGGQDIVNANNLTLAGSITNSFGTITTLPNYNRQVFRTCIRLDGTVIPSGTSGIGNFFGAGGWVNNYLQPPGLPLPPFAGVASTGGFVNYCFLPTNAGIIRSCKLIMPYSAVALTASIVETGLVPVGGITGANLLAAVATPLATFSQVGIGANTEFTLVPSVSILPTAGAFSAGTFIAMVITPTWNNVSNHDAVSPATQYYNLVTTIDFEY